VPHLGFGAAGIGKRREKKEEKVTNISLL